MTEKQWQQFYKILNVRKSQLQRDKEIFKNTESVTYSIGIQIEAIDTLLEQIPYKIRRLLV